ncbi:MAG: type II toxin-antitoxin system VapC family toxin [Thermoproteota archaeon]|nr:type II toxin-antitoxin system VapC family toxin [Thermoproteota archaeon]
MYLVDTNIFLEVLLSEDRKDECKRFLRLLRDGKKSGMVTDFTIHSIIVIMDQFSKLKELKTFLLSLLAYKGLHVYFTTVGDEVRAVEFAVEQNLDMDDAIQYSCAFKAKADGIVSFDKHFDGLKVPRLEPVGVI